MAFFKSKAGALPPETLAVIRSWVANRVYMNPCSLLVKVLEDHGKEAYRLACAETFRVLRMRFGTEPVVNIHISVGESFIFALSPAVRAGEDSIQSSVGSDCRVHPLTEVE